MYHDLHQRMYHAWLTIHCFVIVHINVKKEKARYLKKRKLDLNTSGLERVSYPHCFFTLSS